MRRKNRFKVIGTRWMRMKFKYFYHGGFYVQILIVTVAGEMRLISLKGFAV